MAASGHCLTKYYPHAIGIRGAGSLPSLTLNGLNWSEKKENWPENKVNSNLEDTKKERKLMKLRYLTSKVMASLVDHVLDKHSL